MASPDLPDIERNAEPIVRAIGREASASERHDPIHERYSRVFCDHFGFGERQSGDSAMGP
jgi:hypothetical protein